jgi:hypothetical protein
MVKINFGDARKIKDFAAREPPHGVGADGFHKETPAACAPGAKFKP